MSAIKITPAIARVLPISYSKVQKLWYGNALLVRAEHADEIRKARKAAIRNRIAKQKEEITQMQRKLDEWP